MKFPGIVGGVGSLWVFSLGLVASTAPSPQINGLIKVDTIGYVAEDPKFAILTANPEGIVEVRQFPNGDVVLAIPASAIRDLGEDKSDPPLSGDHVWQVEFSAVQTPGHYQIAAPKIGALSYDFEISIQPYRNAAHLALKSFYFSRCGTPKVARHAGNWVDDHACHVSDRAVKPLCPGGADYGRKDYGTLDLAGGWHDAGDFEKKIGHSNDCGVDSYGYSAESLWYLMNAYEWNPGLFADGTSNIPESGNGMPDIVDEARWELDWYLKLQQPDGHVVAKVFTTNLGLMSAPPSSDPAPRFYGPPTREAEAMFVASTAHAARLFANFPSATEYAETLRKAALKTWTLWVAKAPDSAARLWAAGELFRLDAEISGARAAVEQSQLLTVFQPPVNDAFKGSLAYLQGRDPDAITAAKIRERLSATADSIFSKNDAYRSGMDYALYSWNSNWNKAEVGLALLWAAKFNASGRHSPQECRDHAADFLHYFHGLNPLNMTYLTHADLAGGKHGVWQPHLVWFNDTKSSRRLYSGKPESVVDPLWPYFPGKDIFGISDNLPSRFGPAPGYVPGGPTYQYLQLGGQANPPNLPGGKPAPVLKSYRDWNFIDDTGAKTQPWIVNEPGIYETSAYLLLCTAFCPTEPAKKTD